MTPLYALWLPIVLSAVAVYIASTIIHMVLWAWHKNDFPKLANEDQVMDAMRPLGLAPGDYVLPRPATPQEMKSPEYAQKRARGPVVIMTVMPSGPASMARPLALWLLFCVVVGFFAAYLASATLPPGTAYPKVFQVVGTTAFLGYALALWPTSIWYGRKWSTTVRSTIDGVVYALLTAGIFGWLWPR
jgi:hypothetical protein